MNIYSSLPTDDSQNKRGQQVQMFVLQSLLFIAFEHLDTIQNLQSVADQTYILCLKIHNSMKDFNRTIVQIAKVGTNRLTLLIFASQFLSLKCCYVELVHQ